MPPSLASFPEELLVRILALALALAPPLHTFPQRNRTAPLLVSRQFLRIASPLFYHTLHLHSSCQTARVLDTLAHHPASASAVRHIIFAGIWHSSADVLAHCDCVRELDLCLDNGPCLRVLHPGHSTDLDAEAFCYALERHRTVTHLTIRKDPAVYLTHPRPIYVLPRLARAVRHWTDLETVHFAFRVSASPTTLPLAHALSVAPRLRVVRAQLPAVWNELLLLVSSNPSLEKVMLYSEPILGPLHSRPNLIMGSAVIKGASICDDIEYAVFGTGLYMMEARKHTRFSDLIKSGTAVIRTRAHTTISTMSTPSACGTPLGATRAKEVAVGLMANTHRDTSGPPVVQSLALTGGRYAHALV